MSTPTDTAATALGKIQEQAVRVHGTLYAPSVLQEAAALLADLWATGERHGVDPDAWSWTTSLPDAALSVITRRRTGTPTPVRTATEVHALQRALITALGELGIGAHIARAVIVDRLPDTPRWGSGGDAQLAVGIWLDGGWDLGLDGLRQSPVVKVAAPATDTGAAEVAAQVAAIARGQASDPFRRDR